MSADLGGEVAQQRVHELAPYLRAVQAGDAWRNADGTSTETCIALFGVSEPIADITEEMRVAEAVGLVTAEAYAHAADGEARWKLTAAGERLLAEHDRPRQ